MAKDNNEPRLSIPQNSAGYIKALNINKSNAKPIKSVGKDLRSGK
jgi:hypothetical protein